jgi:spermidine synthase
LGGLALAVPLWLASHNRTLPAKDDLDRPRAVVIGAGGCTIPAVLAKAGCDVTAIEPHADVYDAARQYFGADDANIKLLVGYGEEYLSDHDSKDLDKKFHLLLIDAEDGQSTPPQSMREETFWTDAVSPHLATNAVIAVNIISNQEERFELTRIVDKALQGHDVWCCEVPANANVSDRHCIMFATPQTKEENDGVLERFNKEMDKFAYVDMPVEWSKCVEQSRLFRYYTSYFDAFNYRNNDEEGKK